MFIRLKTEIVNLRINESVMLSKIKIITFGSDDKFDEMRTNKYVISLEEWFSECNVLQTKLAVIL